MPYACTGKVRREASPLCSLLVVFDSNPFSTRSVTGQPAVVCRQQDQFPGLLLSRAIHSRRFTARGADHSLMHTLITTGRADLAARDASVGPDKAVLAALKAKLRGETSDGRNITSKTCRGSHGNAPANSNTDINPAIFPRDGGFHRRTGKLQCLRSRRKEFRAEGKRDTTNGQNAQHARDSDPRQGPDGLTATTAKVQWFCGALAKTAEKLSMRRRGGAEAFLLSVFEDCDRWVGLGDTRQLTIGFVRGQG